MFCLTSRWRYIQVCIGGRLEEGLDRVGSGCGGGNTEEEHGQVLEDEGIVYEDCSPLTENDKMKSLGG